MSKNRPEPKSAKGTDLGNLADLAPGEQGGAAEHGPAKKTTVDVSKHADHMLKQFRLHVLTQGAVEGMDQFEHVLIRAIRELVEELEQRYNSGQQFPPPQSRLPKGSRAGVLGPTEELERFGPRIPAQLITRMRGALLYLTLNDEAREAEQIGMAPEFYTRAVVRLLTDVQQRTGIALE